MSEVLRKLNHLEDIDDFALLWDDYWVFRAHKNFEKALSTAQEMLRRWPEESLVFQILGHVQWQLGLLSEAERSIRAAIVHNPQNAEALLSLGLILNYQAANTRKEEAQSKYEEAREVLRKCVQHDWANAQAHNLLGEVSSCLESWEEALQCFQTALELEPESWAPWMGIGRIYFLRANWADAEAAFQSAVNLNPRNWASWSELGRIQYLQGNLTDAEESFWKALELGAEVPLIPHWLCLICHKQQRHGEALEWGKLALQWMPSEDATEKAKLTGIMKSAVGALEESLHLNPGEWLPSPYTTTLEIQPCLNHEAVDDGHGRDNSGVTSTGKEFVMFDQELIENLKVRRLYNFYMAFAGAFIGTTCFNAYLERPIVWPNLLERPLIIASLMFIVLELMLWYSQWKINRKESQRVQE